MTARLIAIALGWFFAGAAAHAEPLRVTDVLGREVVLDKPAERILLSESRYVHALAVVETGNPLRRVVGMLDDLGRWEPATQKQLQERWPETKSIAHFGMQGAESVSAEKIITLAPELAIFGVSDHGPGARNKELLSQLEAAGVKVLFIDFRQEPLTNTVRSIEILGQALGRPERAQQFAEFYEQHKQRVAQRIAGLKEARPRVFLQAHVGRMDCCVGMARGMLGPMVEFAGGHNISAEVSPGPIGRHTLEFLIAGKIDVFIGTASGSSKDFAAGRSMIVLGTGVDRDLARRSLARAVAQPGMEALPAVQSRRAYGIWHDFYNSPHNIYVIESFAKWLHPALFADVDPDATLAELYQRFSPFTPDGTYGVGLQDR